MELTEFLKVYGPLAMGWIVGGYLGKFILDRYDKDLDARVKLASALEGLTKIIEGFEDRGKSD